LSKLNKRVAFPFTGEQPCLPAAGHRTIPSQEDIVTFYRTHERVSWDLTEFLDMPWAVIQVDALTPADVYVLETTMLVESNAPDYVANLIEFFKADQDVCDFIMMWGMEEWKHYYALRDLLTKIRVAVEAKQCDGANSPQDQKRLDAIEASVRRALDTEVDAVREASEQNWGIPAHYTAAQLCASTTVQEFVTADFYRNHARNTKEPTLARIENLLAKDETRHEMFYEERVKACIASDPAVLPLVIESLKEFGMPGAYLVDDYGSRRAAMETAAFPTMADKKGAFVRLFSKVTRVVGRENTMRIFTEGNYLSDGVDDPSRKKMKPELVTRMLTRRLG
jgi:rubrerythrin